MAVRKRTRRTQPFKSKSPKTSNREDRKPMPRAPRAGRPGHERAETVDVRDLIFIAERWVSRYRDVALHPHWHIKGPSGARSRSLARILRAAWVAYVTTDDEALDDLGLRGSEYLVKKSFITTGAPSFVDLTRYVDRDWTFGIADIIPAKGVGKWKSASTRALFVTGTIDTLAHWVSKGFATKASAPGLADNFLATAISPFMFGPFLAEHGVWISHEPEAYRAALAKVTRAFCKVLPKTADHASLAAPDLAELLFRRGMLAIGIRPNAVKSLLSYRDKAGKRGG
jgi:hypothetical protein